MAQFSHCLSHSFLKGAKKPRNNKAGLPYLVEIMADVPELQTNPFDFLHLYSLILISSYLSNGSP